jgi:hypothetical protein
MEPDAGRLEEAFYAEPENHRERQLALHSD